MRPSHKYIVTLALVMCGIALSACGGNTKPVESSVTVETENTGPWKLTPGESGISFITVKKGNVAEIGTFAAIDGKVTDDGSAEFTIVLDSVNTNNETRDPRMRQFLFETDKHPYINVTATVDLVGYGDMQIGERRTILLAYDLGLHGMNEAMESYVMVTRLGVNKVLVENKAPVIIDAADFDLGAGVEKLRELASLDSITPVVPVTFSLVFER